MTTPSNVTPQGDSDRPYLKEGIQSGHTRNTPPGPNLVLSRKGTLTCKTFFFLQNQEKIIIDEHPKSQKRNEGSRAEFEFKVQGTNPLSYQWFRDGVELLGQNNASLILECVELQDFGCYACRVSYQVGNDETMEMSSRPAVLDVIPQCLNGLSKYYILLQM